MELIPVKERLPERNGKYLVLTQTPVPNCAYIGAMPWNIIFDIVQYVVEPRGLGEHDKVPYWAYDFGENDNTFFITHWAELPKIPEDLKAHQPDKEKAINLFYEMINRRLDRRLGKSSPDGTKAYL